MEIIKNSRAIGHSDNDGMQINDLEGDHKNSALGNAISKTKVQPLNDE
jgi:hypothetical protein